MNLEIDNYIIDTPIFDILTKVRDECGTGMLKSMKPKKDYISVTCPNPEHKGGHESTPSCSVFASYTDDKVKPGTVHCFTCGYSVPLQKLVADCFGRNVEFGKQWLIANFGHEVVQDKNELEFAEFTLPKPIEKLPEKKINNYLDESILNEYNYYHPYMTTRKLTPEVIQKFKIGYDHKTDSLTFPVWDYSGGLITITRRSVTGKRFELEAGVDKAVYLLNFIREENIRRVFIVESQINALTCWSYGIPAVALFGTGSKAQYEILRHTDINQFVLCFDGDAAGRHGAERFKKNMNYGVFIDDIIMPGGKDVNDLTKEEFLKIVDKYTFI